MNEQPAGTSGPPSGSETTRSGSPARGIVAQSGQKNRRQQWFAQYPWLIYVFPLLVFMVVGMLEPSPPADAGATAGESTSGWSLPFSAYPILYTLKTVLTLAAIAFVWPDYGQFPLRVSPWAFVVGVIGIVLWIGLCEAQSHLVERFDIQWLKKIGQRSAYNPFEQLGDRPGLAWAFLAVRFFGLAVIVPVIEEFFLRGFVMRYFVRDDWWNVPFGDVNQTAVAVAMLLPIAMHPLTEALAVAVWFGLVTWLMVKTRNIWDCVVAHMVTNFLLGVYVINAGAWKYL